MGNASVTRPMSSTLESTRGEINSGTIANPYRTWLCCTVSLTIAVAAIFVFMTTRADLFGLQGRSGIRIHTLPRFSLYLMTYRFIPDNFNGLLIGNWLASSYDTSVIHSYKVFNAPCAPHR